MYLSNAFRESPQTLVAVLLLICLMQYVGAPTPTNAAITKRVYLTSGTSWTVPNDWVSSSNTIEAIGAGAFGTMGSSFAGGNGGGGGAYAKISNLSLTGGASVSYKVGSGSDTVFNSTATTCAGSPTPSVCADAGATSSGGSAAGSIGTVKYDGGSGDTSGATAGGGGGGAAGPGGIGEGGGSGDFSGGQGGQGGAGLGGLGGFGALFAPDDGGSGENGKEYDSIPGHGSGGGGGGGAPGDNFVQGTAGGGGGMYGGGGGGGGSGDFSGPGPGGPGGAAQGLIIITYDSTDTGSSSQAKVKISGGQVKIIGGRVLIK